VRAGRRTARLLRRRGRGGPPLLAVPAGALWARAHPALVPAWDLRMSYAELVATSNFSFLRAGSHPEELVAAAAALGLGGVGLCDRNSFAGAVRGHVAARDLAASHPDFRYVVGVRLAFADGTPDIIAYPSDRA